MSLTIGIRLVPDQSTMDMAARLRAALPTQLSVTRFDQDDAGRLLLMEFQADERAVARIADKTRAAFAGLKSQRPHGMLERLICRGPGIQWWSTSESSALMAACHMAHRIERSHGGGIAYVDPPHILVARTEPDAPTPAEFQTRWHPWSAVGMEIVAHNGATHVVASLLFD